MKWLTGLVETLTKRREPTARETLEAHLAVLQEQYAAPAAVAGKRQLGVAGANQGYRVVVEAGLSRVDVQCTAPDELRVHLRGDAFLLPGALDSAKRSLLRDFEMTWTRQEGAFSMVQAIRLPNSAQRSERQARKKQLSQLAARIEVLLTELLRHPKGAHYSVAIEKQVPFDNSDFIQAVQKLVKTSDQKERRLVYQAFVNGWFFVPIEPVNEHLQVAPIQAVDAELGGKFTWTAYSDAEALKQDKPNVDFVQASGIRVTQAAHAAGIAALKLNPASKIGGEFYGHELETLANYLKKRGIRA